MRSIQALIDYKTTPQANHSDIHLTDMLDDFYARFEALIDTLMCKTFWLVDDPQLPSFLMSFSQTTSPGLSTPTLQLRMHNNVFTFCRD